MNAGIWWLIEKTLLSTLLITTECVALVIQCNLKSNDPHSVVIQSYHIHNLVMQVQQSFPPPVKVACRAAWNMLYNARLTLIGASSRREFLLATYISLKQVSVLIHQRKKSLGTPTRDKWLLQQHKHFRPPRRVNGRPELQQALQQLFLYFFLPNCQWPNNILNIL